MAQKNPERATSVQWPETVGEYRLHESSDTRAFYYYQMGGMSFYQGLVVEVRRALTMTSTTIVALAYLSGNGWGSKCNPNDPNTYNWILIKNEYYASLDRLFAAWAESKPRPMTNAQLKAWEKRAVKQE